MIDRNWKTAPVTFLFSRVGNIGKLKPVYFLHVSNTHTFYVFPVNVLLHFLPKFRDETTPHHPPVLYVSVNLHPNYHFKIPCGSTEAASH